MFGISNELVNIWSHGLGLVVVLVLAFYFYPASANFHLSTKTDVFIAAVFFFAACQCLICSTVWHVMNSISDSRLLSSLICTDYLGISLLISTSIMTTIVSCPTPPSPKTEHILTRRTGKSTPSSTATRLADGCI